MIGARPNGDQRGMGSMAEGKRAADVLVECLALNGVRRAFGVPGESYLEVLDALIDSGITFVTCRQEGGAAMMAAAHGRLTGQPGLCMVTRGPGVTNATAGLHLAQQDSLPLILLVGQVARDQRGREAFQEVEYRRFLTEVTKWVAEIDDADRIPEFVARAFAVARGGRPGPVALILPEDMLHDRTTATPVRAPVAQTGRPDMAPVAALLANAERPLIIAGGSRALGWDEVSCAQLAEFASRQAVPVGLSFRAQDLMDNRHPAYAGHVGIGIDPALAARVREADVIIALGARLGEMTTSGYTLLTPPRTAQKLVHIHPDEPGLVYQPDIAIHARPDVAMAALTELPVGAGAAARRARLAQAHADYLAFSDPRNRHGRILAEIVAWFDAHLPDDAILTNGAGNYTIWPQRFFRFRRLGGQIAPTSGSMGFGLPAAIAASLERPEAPVVAFAGDGCLMMVVQELATAVQHGARILVVVVDNGEYGTIRMHQERRYPGRVSGTAMTPVDFAALARAMGAEGTAVTCVADVAAAYARMMANGGVHLVHLRTDPRDVTPALRRG